MMNDDDDGDKEENGRETLDWMGKEYSYDDDGNFDGDDDDAYAQDGDDDGERETLDSSICVGKEGENPGKPVNSARRPYLNMHTAGHDHHDHLDDDIDCEGKEDGSRLTIPVHIWTCTHDHDDDDDLEDVDANDDFGKVLQWYCNGNDDK